MKKNSDEFLKILESNKKKVQENLSEAVKFKIQDKRSNAMAFSDLIISFGQVNNFNDVHLDHTRLGRTNAYHVTHEKPSQTVILYLHGGVFIYGLKHLHGMYNYFTRSLASATGAQIYAIDYSIAPENKFPTALNESFDAYLDLLKRGFEQKNICIAGDSAGGNLCLALLLKIRDNGLSLPSCAVVLSPWIDLALTGESYRTRNDIDPFGIPELDQVYAKMYLGEHDAKSVYASPLYADLKGFCPLMIVVGGREVLYDDAIRLAVKAKKAGVEVTLDIEEDMMHVYPVFGGIFSKGKKATKRISAFIKNYTS